MPGFGAWDDFVMGDTEAHAHKHAYHPRTPFPRDARLNTARSLPLQVQAIAVLSSPLSVEDGTLTRTMKPRRPAIMQKYAEEVARLEAKLR
jgi:hypothetical protein